MKILGIDPGLTTCGWGVVQKDAGTLSCLDFGAFKTSPQHPTPHRLYELSVYMRELLKHHGPDLVAVETLFFGVNRATVMRVAEARGVILLAAAEQNIPVVELTPLETKKALSVFGRAPKQQMRTAVKLVLGMNSLPSPADAADALALAVLAALKSRG